MTIEDLQGEFVQPRLKLHHAYTLCGIVCQCMICTYESLLNDILCILYTAGLAQSKSIEPLLKTQHQLLEIAIQVSRQQFSHIWQQLTTWLHIFLSHRCAGFCLVLLYCRNTKGLTLVAVDIVDEGRQEKNIPLRTSLFCPQRPPGLTLLHQVTCDG